MSSLRRVPLALATSSAGVASATTSSMSPGKLHGFFLTLGTLTAGMVLTISDAVDNRTLWTKTTPGAGFHYPRVMAEGATGTASTLTEVPIPTSGRITVSTTGGGDTKLGSIDLFLE